MPRVIAGRLQPAGQYVGLERGSLSVAAPRELIVVRAVMAAYGPDGKFAAGAGRALDEEVFEAMRAAEAVPFQLDEEIVEERDDEVVWGGDVAACDGRFLLHSAARLWPLLPGGRCEGMPVVLTRPRPSRPVREWLDAFGVRVVELPQDGAVRFTRAHVPEPAWRSESWLAPELRDVHRHARRGLGPGRAPPGEGVAWLSRAGSPTGRIPHDESLLEWILGDSVARIGLDELPLAGRVAALEGFRAVAGVIDPSFHALLVAERTPDCLYLCPPWDHHSVAVQHRLLDGEVVFRRTLRVAGWTPEAQDRGIVFPAGYRIAIPETLAAIGETIHPRLLENPRLAAFAAPERAADRVMGELDRAVLRALRRPDSAELRVELGRAFRRAGLERLAADQLALGALLVQDPRPRPDP